MFNFLSTHLLDLLTIAVLWMVIGYFVVKLNDHLLVKFFHQTPIGDESVAILFSAMIWPILMVFLMVLVPIQLIAHHVDPRSPRH